MTTFQLTESDVRRMAADQSFQRGEEYHASGAVREVQQRGDTLTARVRGSQADAYRVTITLRPGGIASTRCSCPYDWGGICKHTVATLLTLVRRPDTVQHLASIDDLLAEHSKQDLIALVKEMIALQPDLARLLDLPLRPDSSVPLDLAQFEKQVHHALSLEDAEQAGRELNRLNEMAGRYLEAGDPSTAGTLYQLIVEKALVHWEGWWPEWDSAGDVSGALSDSAQGLGECLEQAQDAETRQPWLEVLLDAELEDIRNGGLDFIEPAGDLVLDHATDEEWGWIQDRVRDEVERSTDWTRATLVRFLAARLEVAGQDNEVNALILSHGTPEQRAFLLLKMGRVEDALQVARQHFASLPGLVLNFANELEEAGHSDAAVAYVADQGNDRYRYHYRPWLAKHYEEHGNPRAALDVWRRQFEESPQFEIYQQLHRLGQEVGNWDKLRSALLDNLDPLRHATLLVSVALNEGDVAQALKIVSRPGAFLSAETLLRVAVAAAADHPRAALEIYRAQAERAIAHRNRTSYAVAAGYLQRVRDLHRQLGEDNLWKTYIARLRQEHRRLRALQEELDKAGL